jgi:hypothetical protein
MSKLTTVVCFAVITMATHRLEAALIISVEEDTVNNEINFSWNGIIGDSGGGEVQSWPDGGDFIRPVNGRLGLADRSRGDVNDGGTGIWVAFRRFAGEGEQFGSGGIFSAFSVTGNTPWGAFGNGYLYVGAEEDGGTAAPDLATHTFTGSFTLTGDFATYGLFDTVGADISAGPVTLWAASTGSGSIVFQSAAAVPEPSTFSMLAFCGIAMAGYTRLRRRRK